MKKINNEKGVVLIYALIILMIVTAIGLGISILIIREINLTSHSHYATQAFYAAESGIERGLYTVKVNRLSSNPNLAGTISAIKLYQGIPPSSSQIFSSGANYNDQGTNDQPVNTLSKLAENSIWQLDLSDIDNPSAPVSIGKIEINGDGDGYEWLEFSSTEYNTSIPSSPLVPVNKVYFGHSELINIAKPATVNLGGSYVGYRMRLRALFADINNITVTAYNTDPIPKKIDFPSQIILASTGSKGDFQQAITASLPWKMPLSEVYDYVLFSENEISKTELVGNPIYTSGLIQVEKNIQGVASCSNCTDTANNCGQPGATCFDCGWLSSSCVNTVSCTIDSLPNPSFCQVPANGGSFTLPIDSSVPSYNNLNYDYYLSVRVKSDTGTTSMKVNITDPPGNPGASLDVPNITSSWKSCTVSNSFHLSQNSNRTIQFMSNIGTINKVNIDWYQISTYKIFDNCQ